LRWVTRENASLDRIASSWLIKNFVDPAAEFLFVPRDEVMGVIEEQGAIGYGVPGVALNRMGGRSTFENILLKYGLTENPGLVELAKIVNAASASEDGDPAPEGLGLRAIADGFAMVHRLHDHRKIELETPMYDALYAWCEHRARGGAG
jgi:hypothetical protein